MTPKELSELYYKAINVFPPSTNDYAGFVTIAEAIKAKMLEARLDEIRLSNLTSAIDSVRAKYMQNRVAELQALSTKEAQND